MLIHRESGEEVSILANCSPVRGTDGSIQGAVAAMQDITLLKQAEMQKRLLEFREKERLEMARDLHDGPIQDLSGVLFNIQFVKEVIPDRAIQLEFEQVGLGVQGVIRSLREVTNALRPPSLIRFGLSRAIRVHAEEFGERHPQYALQLDLFDDANQIPEQMSLALYRIYQEALNNIVRHAQASVIHILLSQEEQQVVLEIGDDGCGFAVTSDLVGQTRTGHFGLAGMKERAELIGAALTVSSAAGQGTVVRVTVGVK
jgi:signal transduction histidine kinase